jgi:methylated-DNA-[protein]-cysteine S-methyltransferase
MTDVLRLMVDRLQTPIGKLVMLVDRDGYLRAVDWVDHDTRMRRLLRLHYGANGFQLESMHQPNGLADAINAYFAGELSAIAHVRVRTAGTRFQSEVWRALRDIPPGTTVSYRQLAQRIGRPDAARAVGLANGSNPVGIVVPCHRVIGSNGSLTGYGGGIQRKGWLLRHEQRMHRST